MTSAPEPDDGQERKSLPQTPVGRDAVHRSVSGFGSRDASGRTASMISRPSQAWALI